MPASALPNVTRPDSWTVVVRERDTRGEDTTRAADAVIAEWDAHDWPAGLLSRACLRSVTGNTLLEYEQWADPRPGGTGAEDTRPPEPARAGTAYQLYRSSVTDLREPTGCAVTVVVDLGQADPAAARKWVDEMFDGASEHETGHDAPLPGLLAAHFHLSLDGSRVLNYAEWTSPEAHRSAIPGPEADDPLAAHAGRPGVRVIRFLPHGLRESRA
ncbi:hypothetical protein C1701_18020 [Actinoalloteichus sp. AHMU CJ021]|uniref:antibiotic biosynthesis monooxygenase n=1 Tax=Actinoalloteichus sp. AHMU CJ021 TaxID=2072503 RepID=UPI000CA00B2A|nr:hypothetical protein C1701_18020 [Actinoalloteichus sp. AHMU CJ021]